MGDRAQVAIKEPGRPAVYLYTHWDGANLTRTVARALNSPAALGRLMDMEYLARIIFCEMLKGATNEATGYGIGTTLHGDLNYPLIKVMEYKGSVGVWVGSTRYTYDEFITEFL